MDVLASTSFPLQDISYDDDNLSQNITHSEQCAPLRIIPLIITSGLVACGIIIGNTLVIVAIVGGNAKFFRPMYWFIIHLSCSDLLIGIMMLWNYCLAAIFNINNTLASLSILQGIWVTSACSSVLGILLLAVDRYMQVVHRRAHTIYFNQCTVALAILVAWLIPIFIFLIAPFVFNWSCKDHCRCHDDKYMECATPRECSQLIPPFTKSYTLTCVIYVMFILPWPILVYSLIFIKARKSTQVLHQKMRHRDIRLIRTLIVIMLAFIITLTPTEVVMTIDYFVTERNTKLIDYSLYVFVFASLNSLANPILYIWRIPAIRISLQRRLRYCYKSKSVRQELRVSRTLFKTTDNFHSDASELHPSPTHPHRATPFHFCGRRFNANLSDVSQTSTPTSQRHVSKKAKKRPHKPFEMTALSPASRRAPPPLSPLCSNDRVEILPNSRTPFVVHPARSIDDAVSESTNHCTVLHHSNCCSSEE